jgi:peptidoglycan/LPS O-acetylase OafA/YrhL
MYGYLVGFLVGYLLAELILVLERRPVAVGGRTSRTAGWLLLAAGLACSIRLQVVSFDRPRSDYMMAMNVVAALVVSGVVLTPALHRWLSGPISHFLGRISFGLYLTHFLVICSFSSALYLALIDILPYGLVVALVGGLSLPVALSAGYAFALVIEEGVLPQIKRPLRAAVGRAGDFAYSFVRSSVLRILP